VSLAFKNLRNSAGLVSPADWACLLILAVITVTLLVSLMAGAPVGGWLLVHLMMLAGYAMLAVLMVVHKDRAWVPLIRSCAVVAVMFGLYSTLGQSVFIAIPWNGDPVLDAMDTWLFGGVKPVLWAEQFITFRSLEFFSFCYGFFVPYLYLSILTGLFGRPEPERTRFLTGFAILYAISFLGYLFVPARGPVVHNAGDFMSVLSGGTFHGIVLHAIDASGGPHGAFPSLHVGAAAYACLFDLRYNRLRGLTYLPLVVLIAMATVFLRYHYVIDWITGLMIAAFATWLSHRWMARREAAEGEHS
jgi:hypothetical protein